MGAREEALRTILKNLGGHAVTPEREALLSKATPTIEKIFDQTVPPDKAWLFGSYGSNKPNPKDIDIMANYGDILNIPTTLRSYTQGGVDYWPGTSPTRSFGSQELRDIVTEGKSRYGPDYKWRRILGLGGLVAGGYEMSQPDESEASPLGKIVKATKAVLSQRTSSSAERLMGSTIEGKTVVDVKKGQGKWRDIIFDDGTTRPATTDDLEYLCRRKGIDNYTNLFQEKDMMSKIDQARRSLDARRPKAPAYGPVREPAREGVDQFFTNLQGMGQELPDMVMVQDLRPGGKYHSIPRAYADVLERIGEAKIVRGKAEEQLFNKFKPGSE